MPETATLAELCIEVIDCEHKTAPEDPAGSYWSIGTPAMAENRIDFGQAKRISETTYNAWTRRGIPKPGDVILAREAPVGPVVRVPESTRVALGQRTVLLRPNSTLVDPNFFYYALIGGEMQSRMRARAEGSTVAHLNVAEVRELQFIDRPPLDEQRAISRVLGALDDKIESNCRLGNLTDEILSIIWAGFAEPAPSLPISDSVDFLNERIGSRQSAAVVLAAVNSGHLVSSSQYFTKRVYSADISRYLAVPRWAFAYNPARANIGSIGLNHSFELGAVSPVYVVAAAKSIAYAWWLELALKTESVKAEIEVLSSGSVRQVLRASDFGSISIPTPSSLDLQRFHDEVSPLLALRSQAHDEIAVLENLRDELLPELLSGRLRVRDAEEVLEGLDRE